MEEIHPLFGKKILALPSATFPTKLDVINYVRFTMESANKSYQSKAEKTEMYEQIGQKIVVIWREAYVTVSVN